MAMELMEKNGLLFRNDRKKTEKQPDYTGQICFDGKQYELAAWLKPGRSGQFFSLRVSEPYRQAEEAADRDPQGTGEEFEPGDPFP